MLEAVLLYNLSVRKPASIAAANAIEQPVWVAMAFFYY
jgi:hypothetical protein